MTIFKTDKGTRHPIRSEDDWQRLGKPASPKHWKAGRSAMETARAWLAVTPPDLPGGIGAMLATNERFGPVTGWEAEPEAKLSFDSFAGNTRNTDLLVEATDASGRFLIAVEAKADESFGKTVAEQLASALEDRMKNPKSMAFARAQQLVENVLGRRAEDTPALKHIRYQLLTATAGATAEAERKRTTWGTETVRVVVLIHEFVTTETTDKKQEANARDLNRFLHRLTLGSTPSIAPGQLLGPLPTPIPHPGIDLFFGKVVTRVPIPVR